MTIDPQLVWWRAVLAAGLVSASACTTRTAESCALGPCLSAELPYCDVEGQLGGVRNECIAVSCTPSEFALCRDDQAVTCNASGDNYDLVACELGCDEALGGCRQCVPNTSHCDGTVLDHCNADGRFAAPEPCALGCVDAPSPHCSHIEPRYLPDACDVPSSGDLVTGTTTFDTDLDSNCTGGIVTQNAAASVCVVHYETITVPEATRLNVRGDRAIAFVADRELAIDGLLDVSADGEVSGPGGGLVFSGGADVLFRGGGGAGFKTPGGAGGTASADGGAANGGPATLDPALLSSLVGGPRSGSGSGGGGGGALTLIACKGSVTVVGKITAGGGGGRAGGKDVLMGTPFVYNAFGGGAGGNVVLQAPRIVVTGGVFANGGGGGGGKPIDLDLGSPGTGGYPSATLGGYGGFAMSGSGAGSGGQGGIRDQLPIVGLRSTLTGATAGGGGGSVGFLQAYTPAGIPATLTPSEVSPQFQPNGTLSTR